MARRRSKHTRAPRPLITGRTVSRITRGTTSFLVREIRQGQSEKDYRCPGCNQLVRAGTAHVVAWPENPPIGIDAGVAARRHWHTYCWEHS